MQRMTGAVDETYLLLASGSPRRRELLGLTGWRAEVFPVKIEEEMLAGEEAGSMARRLARKKATIAARVHGGAVVLGADTVVVDGDTVLGKPEDAEDATGMLRRLCGRRHEVITALTIVGQGGEAEEACMTEVPMRSYSEEEIARYVASGSPLDKAGGYGIQDERFSVVAVDRMKGCYANVMGLPLCHLMKGMRSLGVSSAVDIPLACQKHTGYHCRAFAEILRG